MKRLAFVRYKYSNHGGAEKYLSRVTEELKNRGIGFEILTTTGFENAKKISIPALLPSFLKLLFFAFKVAKLQKKENLLLFSLERIFTPDIYRAGDGVHREWLEIKAKEQGGAWRDFFNPKHHVQCYLEKKTFLNAKKIIANSHLVKHNILKHFPIEKEKIEVIYNGLPEFKKAEESKEEIRQKLGISTEKIVFLYVGSGFFRKGVKYFLEILSKIDDKNFEAIIIGKEKKMDEYKNLAQNFGIENQVRFLGVQDDVNLFYQASDIFLFPTLYEPFSNATLEAMAFGNAVITTRDNGVSEVLEDKDMIMESAKDMRIIKKIDYLMKHPEKIREIGERNRATAQSFTLEKNVEQTLNIIEQIR